MKPGNWWRAQNTCVHSSKLIRLSDKAHRNWFNLNCVANAHGGVLPDIETVATDLRISVPRAAAAITEMVAKRLFDKREDGSFVPHDWDEWQFKTDTADRTNTERQKRFRAKHNEEMKSLRNIVNNNRYTVLPKRPETETEITPTVSVEREQARQGSGASPELLALLAKGR